MSSVSRIVNIVSVAVPATACLLILGYLGAIILAQWAQCSPHCKIADTDNRASGIRGYIPQLPKCQYFWCIGSILKEFYCISEASLGVLKVEL